MSDRFFDKAGAVTVLKDIFENAKIENGKIKLDDKQIERFADAVNEIGNMSRGSWIGILPF